MLATDREADAVAGVEYQMIAGVEVDLPTGLDRLQLIDPAMAVTADVQVVAGKQPGFAVAVHGALFFGLQHADAVPLDGFVALVADVQAAVVFHLVFEVALGAQVNQFATGAVFHVQFVEAAIVW